MDDTAPIRVFLLDDHEVVREGVRTLLEATGRIHVVGEAATCEEALARIPATRPRVAILDVHLPDCNGIEVCREVRAHHPEVACVMLTSFSDDEALLESIVAGASGYVLKQVRGRDLVRAVERVARGESLIDARVKERLLARLHDPHAGEDPRIAALTPLEHQVLDLVAQGRTNHQIATELGLAEKTVKNYVSSILLKLGVSRRTEAAVLAVRAGAHG